MFCTNKDQYGPTYELMDQARSDHPRAFRYHRDFWLTGFDHGAGTMSGLAKCSVYSGKCWYGAPDAWGR